MSCSYLFFMKKLLIKLKDKGSEENMFYTKKVSQKVKLKLLQPCISQSMPAKFNRNVLMYERSSSFQFPCSNKSLKL